MANNYMYKNTWKCEQCVSKRKETDKKSPVNRQTRAKTATAEIQNKNLLRTNGETDKQITKKKGKETHIESSDTVSESNLSILGDTINPETSFVVTTSDSEPQMIHITIDQLEKIIDDKLKKNNQSLISELKIIIRTELANTVTELINEMEQKTNRVISEQNSISKKIIEVDKVIKNLEAENNKMNEDIAKIQEKIQNPIINISEKEPPYTEEHQKKLVLYGLIEYPHENEYDLLQRISHAFYNILELDINPYIETVSRIGKAGYRRPIEIELISKRMTNFILQNSHYFQNSGISIKEFISGQTLQQRNHLRKLLREARRNGQRANIRGDKLYINGEPYIAEESSIDASINQVDNIKNTYRKNNQPNQQQNHIMHKNHKQNLQDTNRASNHTFRSFQ